MSVDDLYKKIEYLNMRIDGINESIQQQYEFSLEILEQVSQTRDRINQYMHHNDEIMDVIGEKLFMTFYKVFPEAAEMDKALEQVVKAQKKKPKA